VRSLDNACHTSAFYNDNNNSSAFSRSTRQFMTPDRHRRQSIISQSAVMGDLMQPLPNHFGLLIDAVVIRVLLAALCLSAPCTNLYIQFPVSVEAKLSFVEPGRSWAHSSSPSKAPGISYQGTMKTSARMFKTSGGL